MKPRRSFRLSLMALAIAATMHPSFADSRFDKAVALYNSKHYDEAIAAFQALVGGDMARDAVSHYYLANALQATGRSKEALAEYKASYSLDSSGPAAKHCLQAITQLSAAEATKAPAVAVPAQPINSAPARAEGPSKADAEVTAKLPKLPPVKKLSPALGEVQKWNDMDRSHYLNEAQSQVPQFEESAQSADKLVAQAESVTHSLVPSTREFGESEESFVARRKAAEERKAQLLKPYRDLATTAQTNLEQAKAIVEACQASARGYNGWMPVGR